MNELQKLRLLLDENGIAYTDKTIFSKNDGLNIDNDDISIICHKGSYGGNEGFCEVMAEFIEHDVKGWLTAEECLRMIVEKTEYSLLEQIEVEKEKLIDMEKDIQKQKDKILNLENKKTEDK